MTWIEPLALETWFVNVFSGTPEVFTAVALFLLSMGAAYFRMNGFVAAFFLGLFILMFSSTIGAPFLLLIGIIGGFLVGIWLKNLVS